MFWEEIFIRSFRTFSLLKKELPVTATMSYRVLSSTSIGKRPVEIEETKQSFYKFFTPIQTRWSDNDQYGHVNNAIYYSYFDSVINNYLIRHCGLETGINSVLTGYMVFTECNFLRPFIYPSIPLVGLAISHIGRSSVKYTLGIFRQSDMKESTPIPPEGSVILTDKERLMVLGKRYETETCALGKCVHVFVNPKTQRPTCLPEPFIKGLTIIQHINSKSSL